VLKEIAGRLPVSNEDDNITEMMVGRILSAETEDEVLTPMSAPSLGENADTIFTIHDLRRVDGGMNKELGFYLLIDATDTKTEKRSVYSSGASNIVSQLLWFYNKGKLPVTLKVMHQQSKKDPANTIHWLVKVDHF
jgi:hypothetical protein